MTTSDELRDIAQWIPSHLAAKVLQIADDLEAAPVKPAPSALRRDDGSLSGVFVAAPVAHALVPPDLMVELGFVLEEHAGVWVVVDDCGGVRPATLAERVLWDRIKP